MKKMSWLLGAFMFVATASFACDGNKSCDKHKDKKGAKTEACVKESGNKSCCASKKTAAKTEANAEKSVRNVELTKGDVIIEKAPAREAIGGAKK
ncbi:MAG TPA: hypothetical protein PKX92_03760 [Edaphocola sp.]|nr:hypothetical protein [Edaphocola sp.]